MFSRIFTNILTAHNFTMGEYYNSKFVLSQPIFLLHSNLKQYWNEKYAANSVISFYIAYFFLFRQCSFFLTDEFDLAIMGCSREEIFIAPLREWEKDLRL